MQISKIRNEKENITDTEERQRLFRSLKTYNTQNLKTQKMDKFLDSYHLPKLNQE